MKKNALNILLLTLQFPFTSFDKKLIIYLIFFFLSKPLIAQQTNGINSGTSDLDTPNFIGVYTVDAIGGEQVEIYKNNSNQYFYNPLLLVDWADFDTKLQANKGKSDSTKIKLLLKIHHFDNHVFNELKSLLERDFNISNVKLSSLPFTYFVLKARIGEQYYVINPTDLPTFSSIGSFQVKHTINNVRNYEVYGTLKELNDFYLFRGSNDNLKGSLYMGGFDFSSDYLKATANFANSGSIKKKLFGDETLKIMQKVSGKTNLNGWSINLPWGKGGEQESTFKRTGIQENKRVLNRNFLSELISNNQSEIYISGNGDPDRIREIKNQMINYILENVATKVTLNFNKQENGEYELIKDGLAYAKLNSSQMNAILQSKPKIEGSSKENKEASLNGNSVKDNSEYSLKSEDDITWRLDNNNQFIPTKVDMYILSETQFSSSFSMEYFVTNKEGKKIIEIPFIYPAAWLENSSKSLFISVVDRDNPIGSVLAFAGNKDKIPAGWRLCDGTQLSIKGNEAIFNVIGYSWGGAGSFFHIPDLRGVFLRGVDYGRNLDVDRVYHKVDSIVGSFEDDAFKYHDHGVENNNSSTRNQERVQKGHDAVVNGDEFHNAPITVLKNGGSETRPKNYTVNYIIRCN